MKVGVGYIVLVVIKEFGPFCKRSVYMTVSFGVWEGDNGCEERFNVVIVCGQVGERDIVLCVCGGEGELLGWDCVHLLEEVKLVI